MKASLYFHKTQKEKPKEAVSVSHQLLLKGGFVEQVSSGIFSYLPLGLLVLKKIENVIRQELEKEGVLEILMPVVHPARLWRESGRYDEVGPELLRAKGREEDFVLAMTHEEIITDLVKKSTISYDDLPFVLNQFQTKFRDEPRPRGGLLRLKEFIMQDAYSFDKDEKGLSLNYEKIGRAYERIFKWFLLPVLRVAASSGIMGGSKSEEFMFLNKSGEDVVVWCEKCHFKANLECATGRVKEPEKVRDFFQKKEIKTPRMITVSQLSNFLKMSPTQIIKTLVFKKKDGLVLVLIRGDREINEAKLNQVMGENIELADEEDFRKHNLVPGFVGPQDIKNIPIYADNSLKSEIKYVTGANKEDYHLAGVRLSDVDIKKWVDVSVAKEGDKCENCGGKLEFKPAIELGHLFKLGTKYSEKMRAHFTDKDGKRKPIMMGCFGIGLDRTMAAIIENQNDENGIIWPKSVTPFLVYFMNIANTDRAIKVADKVYEQLKEKNIEVFYDDRNKTAGFKLAEADLMGCPYRLTLSRRSISKDCLELKKRDEEKVELIKIDRVGALWKNF